MSASTTFEMSDASVETYFAVLARVEVGDRFDHQGISVQVVDVKGHGGGREVVATSDGGAAGRGWHEGAETGEPVYYVLMTSTRCFHGWLDGKSRNVTQTG
jgi:hypothetical protein